jgi:hypothetical protein
MPIRICPGCKIETTVLRSHLIPQAVYAYFRSSDGSSPVRVGDDVVMHTDRQIQDYLLCERCEDLLNKGGENWVNPKLATIEKTFPLYELVMKSYPAYEDQHGGIYYTSTNSNLDVEKLTHFALGIFWKAAVHSWSGSKTEPMINLGKYADMIRTWLRSESDFPDDVTLTVTLAKPETALIFVQQPVEIPGMPWKRYRFCVPGAIFSLNVGPEIENRMREICFHQVLEHPIFVSDEVMAAVNARLGKDFVESRKTESYLRQRVRRQKDREAPEESAD